MSNDFEPMDLDKDFIDDIYKEAIEDKTRAQVPVEVLGPKIVKNRSGEVLLSIKKIMEYSEYIDYMFGQMKPFHNPSSKIMTFNDGFVDYFNGYWTEDMDTIIRLYALGIVNGSISPFVASGNGVLFAKKDSLVLPTLNTEDPKFDEWFEKVYKKQYKPRYTSGREPHDD